MDRFAVRGIRYNGNVLDTDHLHRITSDAAVLADQGVSGLAPDSLCDVALTARRLRELADHLEVHALGALEPTGHTEATTGMAAAAWFSREAGLPSNVGRTQVTTARALRHLPQTNQAWLDGRLTREHVRVLTAAANPRIREHIAALEPELIAIAEDRTFHHWRLRITDVVARLDTEGRDPDDPTHTTATWGRSGLFAELRATFAGADVELLEQIIEARTNALYRTNVEEHKQSSDLPLLSRSQLRAHAIIDLILHGTDTDLAHDHDHGDDDDEPRDHEADRDSDDEPGHDADDLGDDEPETDDELAHLTDDLRDDEASRDANRDNVETTAPAPTNTTSATKKLKHKSKSRKQKRKKTRNPLRIGINLVLKAEAEARAPTTDIAQIHPPGTGTTWTLTNPDGRDLPLDRLASLICDADIQALLVDGADNPLNLGRSERLATPDQRRAIIIRDGGCVMPGCDCPTAWVEIHHIKLWSDGGTTDILILAALCRRHHGITHRKGWDMHATADGWFWWTTPSGDTPSGDTFWSQRHGVQRTGPTPPLSADIAA
jgi:hypothetical protein